MIDLLLLKAINRVDNPWSVFDGKRLVVSIILHYFRRSHIVKCNSAYLSIPRYIQFPKPTDLKINMMPIRLNSSSVPDFARQYIDIIHSCPTTFSCIYRDYPSDKVVYLTVQEGWVRKGRTQRRSGLHIERPSGHSVNGNVINVGEGDFWHNWAFGLGHAKNESVPVDGIFMASNLTDSCKIYPVLITDPEKVTDSHGGLEHMRSLVGEGRHLKASELVWLTDRTPHEVLPVTFPDEYVYRQFFRLVTGPISVWYSKHNTSNPLGVLPDAPICHDNKFVE